MKTANEYLRIAFWVFNALILIRLFKQNALDLCSISLSLIRMGIVFMRGWFGRLKNSGDFHFIRGLNLQDLNLSTGVYHVEFLISEIDGEFGRFKKLVYIKE